MHVPLPEVTHCIAQRMQEWVRSGDYRILRPILESVYEGLFKFYILK